MRDSLLSRFRGFFLGALLGEAVGSQSLSHQLARTKRQSLAQAQSGKMESLTTYPTYTTRLMLAQAAILAGVENGTEFKLSNRDAVSSVATGSLNTFAEVPDLPSEAIILTTLPLALLYHDQPVLCQTVLQAVMRESAVEQGQINLTLAAVMVIGQAISLILRERFVRLELIPQILKDLDLQESCPALTEQLLQVQTWIEQSADLSSVACYIKQKTVIRADSLPISDSLTLALYSFLSTPDDFQLALLRSAQLSALVLPSTLVGAISGLYNGLTGLPLSWRRQIWSREATALTERWGMASELEVEQLADRLLACWSGAVDPANWLQHARFNRITAAPRAIRPD